MPIQGLRFNIPSNSEAHLSFQATGSFTSYNPNDGYALIALDRTATLLDYDHKLPSQSGGHFPGPINSYLSMYFVDQSGSGVPGQLIVYASPEVLNIPQFWSIGRAIQTQVTSLDINQGTQPQNPPVAVTRLWTDSTGHLHLLQSNGTDYPVLDSNNFNTYVANANLGGDLNGVVSNGHVNGLTIGGGYWTINNNVIVPNAIYFGGTSQFWQFTGAYLQSSHSIINSGTSYFFNGSTSIYLYFDGAYLVTSHSFMVGGTTPTVFFGGTSTYIQWVGSRLVHSNGITVATGGIAFASTSNALNFDGTNMLFNANVGVSGANIPFLLAGNPTLPRISTDGNNVLYLNCYLATWIRNNANTAFNPISASAFNVNSTRESKSNIAPLEDAISIVLEPTLQGISYTYVDGAERIGFIADDWYPIVPEVVSLHEGEVMGMDYSAVGAIVFQALKEYIIKTDARLDKLEGVPV